MENSKWIYQNALADLEQAVRAFFDSRVGKRGGRRIGFPRFKKKSANRDSFRLGDRTLRCDGRTVTLPKLGTLRTHQSTRKLARRLANGTARITSATVSRTADRWFVSFAVEVERYVPDFNGHTDTIGVDLGLNRLVTLSDGASLEGPKALARNLTRLQRASRAVSRKQPGSANRRKAAAKLVRLHVHIANIRVDYAHKLSTTLVKSHGRVIIEDLHVNGMLHNRHLARAISDAGWGLLRRQLTYKAAWHGCELVVADRWYPSSKMCSRCGTVKTELPLTVRVYECKVCGLVLDRDVNAARCLAGYDPAARSAAAACGGRSAGPAGDGRVELLPVK